MSDLPIHESASFADRISIARDDWYNGLSRYRLWTALAWHEITQRYKRTWIGVGWIAVSFAMFTGVKIFVFSALSKSTTSEFAIHLILGFLVFRLLSAFITGGASIFVSSQNWIKSEPLPITIHLYRLMATNFISFAFAGIPSVLAVWYLGGLSFALLGSTLLAILLYAAFGISVSAIIGIFCTRYRDITHFVATATQILYFVTPILWVAPETGARAKVAFYNPLSHFIDILRQPALDGSIPWVSWQISIGCTLVSVTIAFLLFAQARTKLIFWL